MIKFSKSGTANDVIVTGGGYAWGSRKDQQNSYVELRQGGETISLSSSDVPALKDALDKAVAQADSQRDKSVATFLKLEDQTATKVRAKK